MRVVIVAPPYPLEECPAPPLGVTYVAAAFEASGAEVIIIDYINSRYSPEKLIAELNDFKPDIVGVTSVTMNFPVAARIIKTVKDYDPSIITIMGGPHVTFDALNTLQLYPEIDLIVMGEGEETITELMSCSMNRKQWPDIRGIAFRQKGQVLSTGMREFIDNIDALPLPARHLISHSRYQALGYPISIITSRGCPYSCIFCLGRRMVGKKVRRRKSSLVVDEMEQILSYGWNRINVADDLFTSDRESVRAICGEIHKRGLEFTWSAFARANTVDKKTLEMMRDAGCDSISFGVETGNAEMLERIRKGITAEQIRSAVKICKEVGIIAHASFMVGLPGESKETLMESREFARSLGVFYGYHILTPFPGTTVREDIEKYDLEILTDDWSRYDANSAIVRTSSLTAEEINRFVAEYDEEVHAFFEQMLEGYKNGTNSTEENLRVDGHFKADLVYKILSEDLIESCGTFPTDSSDISSAKSIELLCRRIAEKTGMDGVLIDRTIKHLICSGYLNSRHEVGRIIWQWTM
jgi:anaerobic magnesium-protoporphyrin IX monomethyl ester cyclase